MMNNLITLVILLITCSSPFQNVDAQKPEQIHIAFNGDNGMAISWATKNGNTKYTPCAACCWTAAPVAEAHEAATRRYG